MPKKKPNLYSHASEIRMHRPTHDEVWDDTELIQDFDEALAEWRKGNPDFGLYGAPEGEPAIATTINEAPGIGPWVAVESYEYDPETVTMNPVIGLDDDEFIKMFDIALVSWKQERGFTPMESSVSSNIVVGAEHEQVASVSGEGCDIVDNIENIK